MCPRGLRSLALPRFATKVLLAITQAPSARYLFCSSTSCIYSSPCKHSEAEPISSKSHPRLSPSLHTPQIRSGIGQGEEDECTRPRKSYATSNVCLSEAGNALLCVNICYSTLNLGHELLPCLAINELDGVRDLAVVLVEVDDEELVRRARSVHIMITSVTLRSAYRLHSAELVLLLNKHGRLSLLDVLDSLKHLDLYHAVSTITQVEVRWYGV